MIMTLIQMNSSPSITYGQREWQAALGYDWAMQTVIMKLLEKVFDWAGPEGNWKYLHQDLLILRGFTNVLRALLH